MTLADSVEQTRDALRDEARRRIGVTPGDDDAPPKLRDALGRHGVGLYPLAALGLLGIVDQFQAYGFAVLTPEISSALGIGKGGIAGLIALKTLALALAPLPMALLAQRHARRALLCVSTAMIWSVVAMGTGYVTLASGLLFVLLADGLSTGSVAALHQPLLLDSYPPEARVRVLSAYSAFGAVGNIIAPLSVAGLAFIGLTWRGTFLTMGLASLLVSFFALRLRDPGFGRWDTEQIRDAVRAHHGESSGVDAGVPEVSLSFLEIVRRLMLIPTVRRLLAGYAVYGVLLIPYQTFLFFFLAERWDLGATARGVFFAAVAAVQVASLVLFGRWGEGRFRHDPGSLTRLASGVVALAVVLIALGSASPWFWVMALLLGASATMSAIISPALGTAMLSVVPAEMRPHASALAGIFLGGVGGIVGALFLSGIDRRFGVGGTMVALIVPGVAAAMVFATAARLVPHDLDRMIDAVIEDEEIRHLADSGGRLPMLACRNLDFSYGQLQVLFGVDFTVDDGEMVALLGVNGAGKSTLLKVISGIGLPTRGSVRFRGTDITYLDAHRRLRLGITQIPGGRAVFAPMSVVDNLRAFGYSLGRDQARVDAAIDRSFAAFPALADRRNQRAANLSGGEQQMLGLSKALIVEPQLLLIDELSLGLAPIIVGQLLDMVRRINETGTAVVLVEQSVNIALDLVDHAYFMEKGEIRFDGRAADLLARDDLLRAVFLEGAGSR